MPAPRFADEHYTFTARQLEIAIAALDQKESETSEVR